jgi:CheY-like chemotaxis protein
VSLSVVDEGMGMDEMTLARATEPFFTTKGVGKGTGLGLPMVHGLAEQSGGRLKVASQPGHGTRVEIWLPQAQALAVGESELADAPADPAASRLVLAVDDDNLVLTNMAAMLEDLGHRVIVAASASEALAALCEHPFDLVITDYAMPQMTGLQLAGEIAARRPDLPIVLATGYAELPPGTAENLPRLAKPFSQAELAEVLHDLALPLHAEATTAA